MNEDKLQQKYLERLKKRKNGKRRPFTVSEKELKIRRGGTK